MNARILSVGWAQVVAVLMLAMAAALPGHASDKRDFDIPPGELAPALRSLAQQTGLEVIFQPDDLRGIKTQGVKGNLSPQEAVARMIDGTKLVITTDPAGVILVAPAVQSSQAPQDTQLRLAQRTDGADSKTAIAETNDASNARAAQEIVVTGSHIRGQTTTAYPVHVYTREEIVQAGFGSVEDFIRRLPMNFNGGASDGTVGQVTGGGDVANAVNGSGVNLRGLGNKATLVLVNGRRTAPGNLDGDYIDISLIPLAAVERIEVVPDGASAIYGSDAIGGAINFILRRDFSGFETQVRYGSVTEGSLSEMQVSQTAGTTWGSGSVVASYEYLDKTPLNARDRKYTAASPEPFYLLPSQRRHGVLVSLTQSLGERAELFGASTYSKRDTSLKVSSDFFSAQDNRASIESYSATLGARNNFLSDRLHTEVSATYSRNDTDFTLYYLEPLNQVQSLRTTAASVVSLDATLGGSLGEYAAGTARFVVGGQFRRDAFDSINRRIPRNNFDTDREVVAAFAEFRLPLVGPALAGSGEPRVEMSLAGRHEDYGAAGNTTNPQLGLTWLPHGEFKLRSTYGKSFQVPVLSELNNIPAAIYGMPVLDPVTGTNVNVMFVQGGNPNLVPEKADTWSAGFDWRRNARTGPSLSATYYNVKSSNRITLPQAGVPTIYALRDADILGSTIIQRGVSPAAIQALIQNPSFLNAYGLSDAALAAITIVGDYRKQNLTSLKTRGIDFDFSYKGLLAEGQWDVGIAGSRILEFLSEFSTVPAIDLLNTVYNPVDLKVRAKAAFTRGPWMVASFLNYVDSYEDTRGGQLASIASWTTADLTVSYSLAGQGWLDGVRIMGSVINLTDKAPPPVPSVSALVFPGTVYDGANANPLGRFIALQLSKSW